MNSRRFLGSLCAGLAVACAGKSLTVDDDPASPSTDGNSSDGSSGGSATNASGGSDATSASGGSSATNASGGTDATNASGGSSATNASGGSSATNASGGTDATSGSTGGNGAAALPCDLLEADGHPCVAAHSTVRRLRSAYDGPLYQLCLEGPSWPCAFDTLDIGTVSGGYADATAQDEFCADHSCTIATIYDQSGQGNHLEPAPPSTVNPNPGSPAPATRLPVTIDGHEAYGILIRPGNGYRAGCNGCTTPIGQGMPVGDEPQTIYMVTSQHDLIDGCCFDYGNAETSTNNDGNGTAEALNFSHGVIWGTGSGEGPWVMADLENGLYPGWENNQDHNISTNTSLLHDFVTAVLVGDTAETNDGKGRFALYGGDAQAGSLKTMWDGIRPVKPGYVPMLKQGSIILGIAGDNSNGGGGRFYEGVIATGAASKATLDALQAAIVAAGYE
ncbi:MAG TPA: arabinofuranosidase catalytic domain-containing protein [Polyangiaceae bacterium]|nr:arabinofuranosidase catalytic domain-containing protein [Polyangiaceae bacterium]